MPGPLVLNDAQGPNALRRAEIARTRLLPEIAYNARTSDWRDAIVEAVGAADRVLDVGKSMRDRFEPLAAKAALTQTLDLNRWGDYPDLIADLCQPLPQSVHGAYDVVIALAVVECAYDPPAMVDNLRRLLVPGGRLYLFAPFVYQYHAPDDLAFQDSWRFSRDGLAYLLRDFEGVTLQPVRGRYAAAANLLPFWKRRLEPRWGGVLGPLLDRLADPERSRLNAAGYNVCAVKPG